MILTTSKETLAICRGQPKKTSLSTTGKRGKREVRLLRKRSAFFSIEQIKKHTEEAMMLKFKTKVFQGITDKVKDFQNNERPI